MNEITAGAIKTDFAKLKEVIELMEANNINIVFGYSLPDYGSFVAPFVHVEQLEAKIKEVLNNE